MIYLYTREGKAVPVEDHQIDDALGSGNLFFKKGAVNFVDKETGDLFGVPHTQAQMAIADGQKLETWEDAQERRVRDKLGPLARPAALAAGAISGATLGLAPLVATKTGMVDPKTLRQLEEGFPGTTLGGEVVGAVGGAVAGKKLPSPAGMAARLGTGVSKATSGAILKGLAKEGVQAGLAKRTLAKVAGSAVGGSVEGALFSAGGAINEYAIGQTDELGEALVAHIGPGILLGGVTGAGARVVSELGGAAARATASKLKGFAPAMSRSATRDAVMATTGMSKGKVEKIFANKGTKWVDDLRKVMFEGVETPSGKVVPPIARFGQSAEDLGRGAKEVAEEFGDTIGTGRRIAEAAGGAADGAVLGTRIATAAKEILPSAKGLPKHLQKMWTELTKTLPRELGSMGVVKPAELALRKKVWADVAEGLFRSGDTTGGKLAKVIRTELSDALDDIVGKNLDPAMLADYKHATKMYSLLADVASESKGAVWAHEAVNILEKASRAAQRSAMWRMAAGGLGGASLGGVGGAVVGAAALGVGGAAWQRVAGPAGVAVLKNRVANMVTLKKAMDATESRITKSIKTFLKGGKRGAIPASATILSDFTGERERKKAYRKAMEAVTRWQSKPIDTATMLTTNMADMAHAAPDSSTQATTTVTRVKDYLGQSMKPMRAPSLLQPDLDEELLSEGDMRAFAEKLAGSANPLGVIDDFGNLAMSNSEAKAFRENYPALARMVESRVRLAVAEHPERLTYEQVFQLSILIGQPLSYSLTGQAIASAQGVFNPMQEQRPPPAKGLGNLNKLGTAQMGASQRMEMPV